MIEEKSTNEKKEHEPYTKPYYTRYAISTNTHNVTQTIYSDMALHRNAPIKSWKRKLYLSEWLSNILKIFCVFCIVYLC